MTEHPDKPVVIMSDMHHRISGVSATVRALLPLFSRQLTVFFVATTGQQSISARSLPELIRMLRTWSVDYDPIWHVRRNNEMLWGILLRRWVNPRLKLVFTSAAIRRHSAWPRYLISRMDAVIATSEKAASLVPNVWATVPHGVDIGRFSMPSDSSPGFPWDRYDQVVGIVGRVRPEKGTDIFTQAICRVLPEHRNTAVVIVGKTTAKYSGFLEELRREWRKAGIEDRIFVLDEVAFEEMPAVYHSLDIVCCPARYEGFGVVPIEAMVSGTAVIASRTGAYADMISPGVNGELTDCGDLEQLTTAMDNLLSDPEKVWSYKQAGQKIVKDRFSLTNEAAGIRSVYDQLWSMT